jgi:hypothetical protein
LYVEEDLSAAEIATQEGFDCTPTTVQKWLARYDLVESDPDKITYGRLDRLGETEAEA